MKGGLGSRWLYHVVLRDDWARQPADAAYWPEGARAEGFIHASYRDRVLESARLYFPTDLEKLIVRIDPRSLLGVLVEVTTPRGPMPHIHGPVPRLAIVETYVGEDLAALERATVQAPDEILD
ncbi:MAG TPA: DUF952 domain-containing protein [Polyangiaceae bacterium]